MSEKATRTSVMIVGENSNSRAEPTAPVRENFSELATDPAVAYLRLVRPMRIAQRVTIALWICIVIILILEPPWTVHRTLHYRSGYEFQEYDAKISLRSLYASPRWEVYTVGMDDPISLKLSGELRLDILMLEILIASVAAWGLIFLLSWRKH